MENALIHGVCFVPYSMRRQCLSLIIHSCHSVDMESIWLIDFGNVSWVVVCWVESLKVFLYT